MSFNFRERGAYNDENLGAPINGKAFISGHARTPLEKRTPFQAVNSERRTLSNITNKTPGRFLNANTPKTKVDLPSNQSIQKSQRTILRNVTNSNQKAKIVSLSLKDSSDASFNSTSISKKELSEDAELKKKALVFAKDGVEHISWIQDDEERRNMEKLDEEIMSRVHKFSKLRTSIPSFLQSFQTEDETDSFLPLETNVERKGIKGNLFEIEDLEISCNLVDIEESCLDNLSVLSP